MAVLQPTALCNLDCRYCYVPGRQDRFRMDDATLDAAVRAVLASGLVRGDVELLWHAGEPLAAGRRFYERAFALAEEHRPPDVRVRHLIQTNGTLVDDAWARLFSAHNVGVGISLDGPAWLHDRHRRARSGDGSHARVMRGLRRLHDRGITPGAIAVLTRDSLGAPDEIYDFFVDAGVRSVGFNVEETENANRRSSLADNPPIAEYRAFMRRLWRRWRAAPEHLHIREFDQTVRVLRDRQADPHWVRRPDETIGFRSVTIDRHGDVSTFSPELAGVVRDGRRPFVLGNVRSASLASMVAEDAYRDLAGQVRAGVRACAAACEWFELCGGGFVSNKWFEHGTFAATETVSCRLHRQALLALIIEELKAESQARRSASPV